MHSLLWWRRSLAGPLERWVDASRSNAAHCAISAPDLERGLSGSSASLTPPAK